MDLKVNEAPPSTLERAAVDAVLGAPTSGWSGGDRGPLDGHVAFAGSRRAGRRRNLLLPVLRAVQDRAGWVSPQALGYICTCLDIPPAEAYGVASAYALISLEQRPSIVVHVCDDIACRAMTGDPGPELERRIGPEGSDGTVEWRRSPCLGSCEHGSAAFVQVAGATGWHATVAPCSPGDVAAMVAAGTSLDPELFAPTAALIPQARNDRTALRLLRRAGTGELESLDSYRAAGGYQALRRALELGPIGVIAELNEAKLLGRGGAAFPTGAKWEALARNPLRPHYFVANADESEPGTFKDRVLLETDPFGLVEALTIAGLTTGAEQGFVYVRGEYQLAAQRLLHAAEQARTRGLLGDDVMSSGLRFDLEVRKGAGAYIAGEETALFNSIEGRRPEPRNKPPYPVDRGLFGKPTGVNNVETLYCVLEVLTTGSQAFATTGTPASSGTRLFCLSGRVAEPGLYEVPLGTSLRALLKSAGGVRDGRPLRAVLLGGAAGSFVGPGELDLELSFEGVRTAGTTLGSGVVMVLDDTVDTLEVLTRIARFFRDESCGQCVPCRIGTQRQEELLSRLGRPTSSRALVEERALLADLGSVMRDASICGLGQTASSAVESALAKGLIAQDKEES